MANASQFVELARAQVGDRYVLGSPVNLRDPDPTRFDCSSLVEWALGRLGLKLPRHAQRQYNAVKAAGLTIPVSQALKIPGAIVWKKGPITSAHPRAIYHVGISAGDGTIYEAKGSKWGVVHSTRFSWSDNPADTNRWNLAGLAPGLQYGRKASGIVGSIILGAGIYYILKKRKKRRRKKR